MYVSTLTRVIGMVLAAVMLVLTSGLADAKLPVPTEEQRAQVDSAKAKVAWGDKTAAFQTCKVQDKVAASHQADDKAAYTQPGMPCVDLGSSIASVPAASTPASAAKG